MPGALIDLGLIDAVDDLVGKLGLENDIKFSIKTNSEQFNLTDIQNVQLYRTIQEILSNAVKHAFASNINVEFKKELNELIILISDDGQGFNKDDVVNNKGIGLINIKSRIKYLNGELGIESSQSKGTIYHIKFPIAL